MSNSELREITINAMRELVKRNRITKDDGYMYFAFDESDLYRGYAYRGEVELDEGFWLTDYGFCYLGTSSNVDHTLLMKGHDIFGE